MKHRYPKVVKSAGDWKCADCDFVGKSFQSLNVHRIRKHSGKVWNSLGTAEGNLVKSKKKKIGRPRGSKNKAHFRDFLPPVGRTLVPSAAPKTAPAPVVKVNYCPDCGCDLRAIYIALNFQG